MKCCSIYVYVVYIPSLLLCSVLYVNHHRNHYYNSLKDEVTLVIVISLPGGWSFYTFVSDIVRHKCARPHLRERCNYYRTCYLGSITVEERYEQHFYMLPG